MDQLLFFALFVLFSVASALLERRRRRRSLEESRRRHETAAKQGPVAKEVEAEEEEGGWPWPDIFEPQLPSRPRRVEMERPPAPVASPEASAAEALPGEGKYRRAEEELREMEQRVREMDQRTREAERRSLEEFRLMEDQAASRMSTGLAGRGRPADTQEGGTRTRKQGWALTPREARRALVYAEILGPPKSERLE
ncbi:MAG: hypothetical protein HYW07_22075 [Candidatus Latescibacteria bacterium]|nr:hypothetical protein [Candidatus Latescibacterota bacterium]